MESAVISNSSSSLPDEEHTTEDRLGDSMGAYREMSFGMACVMLAICSVGIVTNMISILVYTHSNMRRAPINVLLRGLSMIDLCLSILSIPAFILPGFFSYFRTYTLEMIMCYSSVFVYPLTSTTHTASVWTFVIIAVERWHAVRRGGRSMTSIGRQRSLLRGKRRRNCFYALLIVCFASFAYNFVRFFEFELLHPKIDSELGAEESLHAMPIVVPLLRNSTMHPMYMGVYYVGLYLITHFILPFMCLVIVNGLTLRVVYLAKRKRRLLMTHKERKEHKTTRMMLTIVVMFIVCYTLLFILNIIEAVDADWFYIDDNRLVAYFLNDISNLLVITNAASTAIIYYIFNRGYRELCLRIIAKAWDYCLRCFLCKPYQQSLEEQDVDILDRRESNVILKKH